MHFSNNLNTINLKSSPTMAGYKRSGEREIKTLMTFRNKKGCILEVNPEGLVW